MKENVKKGVLGEILKGVLVYLIVSIFLIFIFALILTNTNMSKNTVFWINQFIKIVSLFSACFIAVRGEKGLIKGASVGLLGAVLLYVVFLIFGIARCDVLNLLCEIAISILLGGIFGILTINFKR